MMHAPNSLRAPSARAALAAVGAAALSVLAAATGPTATAAPDPCAASSAAKTVGAVATNTGVYLAAHPDTDQALTAISQQPPGPQSVAMLKAYFNSNPEVAADLRRLQQPLVTLSGRCRLPVTLPQMLTLLQSVQQGEILPSESPAGRSVGAESASTSGARVTGPPPGPSATS